MSKRKRGDKIYYSDDINVDFQTTGGAKRPKLDENYEYIRKKPLEIFFSWILYWLIAHPILALVCIFSGITFKDKKNLKELKNKGYFIYSNHISNFDMIMINAYLIWNKRVNILGFTDVLAIPFARKLAKPLGYIPLGDSIKTQKNMMDCFDYYIKKKQAILIFPEAHVWPYYTKIRDFPAGSFHYPAKCNAPVVPIVSIMKKRIFKNMKPKIKLVVGKPIYPNRNKSLRENKIYLHEECLKQMKEISSSYKQYEYYEYIYQKEEN